MRKILTIAVMTAALLAGAAVPAFADPDPSGPFGDIIHGGAGEPQRIDFGDEFPGGEPNFEWPEIEPGSIVRQMGGE